MIIIAANLGIEPVSYTHLDVYKRQKLHLVRRFLSIKENVHEIEALLDQYEKTKQNPEEMIAQIRKISGLIIEEL